jgi:hypothetical protein
MTILEGQLLNKNWIRNINSFTRNERNLMRNYMKRNWNMLKMEYNVWLYSDKQLLNTNTENQRFLGTERHFYAFNTNKYF